MSPTRRQLLVASGVLLAGCVGDASENDGQNGDDYRDGDEGATADGNGTIRWEHDVRGTVHTLHDGTLYATEDFMEGTGGIVALDAESGDREWTFGETGGYSMYTDPTVADALYIGYGDDAIGSATGSLYAVEHDGTRRWEASTGSVYDAPIHVDGTVYAAADDWTVRAVDATDGSTQWTTEIDVSDPHLDLIAVTDGVVYASSGSELQALDVATGEKRWHYDGDLANTVADSTGIYVATGSRIVALRDGEEDWSVRRDGTIVDVVGETVYVFDDGDLCAFDSSDGTEHWCESVSGDSPFAVHDITDSGIYAGRGTLLLLTPDGDVVWETDPDGSELLDVSIADGAVFAATEAAVHRLESTGDVAATAELEGISSLTVDGNVYVGTDDGVYAIQL